MTVVIPHNELPTWWSDAACADQPTDWWFPGSGRTPHNSTALHICRSCPVRNECLTYALQHKELHGIWGGLTESQRNAMRPKAKRYGWVYPNDNK